MASETAIQTFVHKLEEGGWAKWIRRAVLVTAVAYVVNLWFFNESGFRGLNNERAIEQAQIAREITRGNGFSTKMVRPLALWQFQKNTGTFPLDVTPDTYHAPLNPALTALTFKIGDSMNDLFKNAGNGLTGLGWIDWIFSPMSRFQFEKEMSPKNSSYVFAYDKMMAAMQTVFFLIAVLINYFTAWRLFDQRLATFVATLLLVCQRFWDFAMSGLPQMLMMALLSGAGYTIVRAIEARVAGRTSLWWAMGTGVLFGLLALTHAMTLWIFAGALLFAIVYFLPRGRDAALMLAIVALMYGPWMARNAKVSGNPFGVGWYTGLTEIKGTEGDIMRAMEMKSEGMNPTLFRVKIQSQIISQFGSIYQSLGYVLVAPVFFLTMLHLFKRPETSAFRWCIFLMWIGALLGMAVIGPKNETVQYTTVYSNDLHVLLIPLLTSYGFAFVLMMWSRLEINVRLVRLAFMTTIYLISAMPFIQQFIDLEKSPTRPFQWPPYIPPYIAILNVWTNEREIIASDMPWAVAWYADRKSLWVPKTVADFIALNDYKSLGNHLVGLYLTPVSGDRAFMHDIVKGEYKEWAPFVLRQVNVKDFPLRAVTPMPIDNECVFYADRDRWSSREE